MDLKRSRSNMRIIILGETRARNNGKFRRYQIENLILKHNKMNPKIILLRSWADSGKTITWWMVYEKLLPYASSVKFYDAESAIPYPQASTPKAMLPNTPEFRAELVVNGELVVIVSWGDQASYVSKWIPLALAQNPAYLLCSCHTEERRGQNSSVNWIMQNLPCSKYERVSLWTEYTNSRNIKILRSVKNFTAESIIKIIL